MEKKYLSEILIMRPIIIIILVLYHSFAFYNGSWDNPGVSPNDTYEWISLYSYACLLEAFTFVSGYVWYYQICKKKPFISLIKNKFKRLILPALFWGIVYYLLFFFPETHSVSHMIKRTLLGIGHLWYLPMLFWIFLISQLIELLNVDLRLKVIVLLLVSVVPIPLIPFQVTKSLYYLFFFYLGAYFYDKVKDYKWKFIEVAAVCIFTIVVVYLAHVYVYNDIIPNVIGNGNNVVTIWTGGVWVRVVTIIYSCGGIITLFSISKLLSDKWLPDVSSTNKSQLLYLNSLCMGIYIYQEFILKLIYYKSNLIGKIPNTILPWMAFIVTLVISIALAALTLKSRFLKHTIG